MTSQWVSRFKYFEKLTSERNSPHKNEKYIFWTSYHYLFMISYFVPLLTKFRVCDVTISATVSKICKVDFRNGFPTPKYDYIRYLSIIALRYQKILVHAMLDQIWENDVIKWDHFHDFR